jgi:serine/threonine-protein kinase
VLASLLAGMAATAWQWREAEREAERTRRVQSVLTELLSGLSPDASGSATVPMIELVRRSWAEAKRRLAGDAALLAEVARPLGLLLAQNGEPAQAREALAMSRAQALQRGRADSPEQREVAFELATVLRQLGRPAEAEPLLRGLIASTGDEFALFARAGLGELALEAGRLDEARALLTQAVKETEARYSVQHRAYVKAADLLATVARAQGQWGEARRWFAAVAAATESARPVAAMRKPCPCSPVRWRNWRGCSATAMRTRSTHAPGGPPRCSTTASPRRRWHRRGARWRTHRPRPTRTRARC